MKTRLTALAALAVLACLLQSCAFVLTPVYGGLYTGVTAPVGYDAGMTGQPHQVLGPVEGKATATSVLGIVAAGDASVRAAYQDALDKMPGAEDLIDVTVDYQGNSILGLYASYTTIVRGKAIKRIQ